MSEYREELKKEFEDEDYRYAYAEDFLNTWVATQIVTVREQRKLNQTDFGKLIGTKQPGVSRLENVNRSTWKVETLRKIARALGVRLNITFETFGTLLDQDETFSRASLMRPEFEDDPAFVEPSLLVADTRTAEVPVGEIQIEGPLSGPGAGRWLSANTKEKSKMIHYQGMSEPMVEALGLAATEGV